jgi:hypothetical protein
MSILLNVFALLANNLIIYKSRRMSVDDNIYTNQPNHPGRRVILVTSSLIILAVAIFLVVFFVHRHDTTKASCTGNKCNQSSLSINNGSVNQPSKTKASPTPSQSSTPSTTPTSTSSNGASSLTNTGPGNIIALFIATTTVGSLGYYLSLRHRLSTKKD